MFSKISEGLKLIFSNQPQPLSNGVRADRIAERVHEQRRAAADAITELLTEITVTTKKKEPGNGTVNDC